MTQKLSLQYKYPKLRKNMFRLIRSEINIYSSNGIRIPSY